jgi:hypothetical protein
VYGGREPPKLEGTKIVTFNKGNRVESTTGPTTGRFGTIGDVSSVALDIRWDGHHGETGYPLGGNVVSGLRNHGQGETTTSVAQSVSLAIDEHIKNEPLWAIEGGMAEITEVGAFLKNAANGLTSIFQVTTSDGQVWDVRVTPGRTL